MKAIHLKCVSALAISLSACACIPSLETPVETPAPVSTPAPVPSPTPTPAPVPIVREQQFDNYLDAPQTPGTWTYGDEPGESLGLFGLGESERPFIIRCDKANRRIGLARSSLSASDRTMTIKTETLTRRLTATRVPGRALVAASLSPSDPLLDAMAITKGRFSVAVEGERTLYLPAWAEVTRVIEDCR